MHFNFIKIQYGTNIYIVPSPVLRQVQREQFHQKELHIHSVASPACVCFASFEWHNPPANIAQEEQLLFSKSGFLYTALLVLCRVDCALKVLKNYKPQNTMRKCILSLSILT